MKPLTATVLAALVGAVAIVTAPSAAADTTCQDLAGNGTACVTTSTVGDPATGSFGVGATVVSGDNSATANLCLVVFASCPE